MRIEAIIAQVANFEVRLIIERLGQVVIIVLGGRLVVVERLFFSFWQCGLFRYQARLQLARQIADFILTASAGRRVVRVAQPDAQLQQRRGNMPAKAHAQGQGQGQQNQAEDAHALQADGHWLLELLHVQADTQLPGDHLLEGDGGRVQPFGLSQHALTGARTRFGEDAVVHAIDRGMCHQRVFHQVIEQYVEAEDVVGHQQLGGRGRRLGD